MLYIERAVRNIFNPNCISWLMQVNLEQESKKNEDFVCELSTSTASRIPLKISSIRVQFLHEVS